jgi:hypothetical protein
MAARDLNWRHPADATIANLVIRDLYCYLSILNAGTQSPLVHTVTLNLHPPGGVSTSAPRAQLDDPPQSVSERSRAAGSWPVRRF